MPKILKSCFNNNYYCISYKEFICNFFFYNNFADPIFFNVTFLQISKVLHYTTRQNIQMYKLNEL